MRRTVELRSAGTRRKAFNTGFFRTLTLAALVGFAFPLTARAQIHYGDSPAGQPMVGDIPSSELAANDAVDETSAVKETIHSGGAPSWLPPAKTADEPSAPPKDIAEDNSAAIDAEPGSDKSTSSDAARYESVTPEVEPATELPAAEVTAGKAFSGDSSEIGEFATDEATRDDYIRSDAAAARAQLENPEGAAEQADAESLPPATYRQRPGEEPRPTGYSPYIYESVPDINSSASDFVPVPDRWRQFYVGKWYDPYNQNEYKGDIPMFGEPGEEWFVETSFISDTLLERRKLPVGVGFASTANAESTDQFGDGNTTIFQQNFIPSIGIIRGNTTFKPPEIEFRIVPVINVNHARFEETQITRIDPARDTTRDDFHLGFNELFIDYHLMNLSDRYDFISTRVGIQHFASDFRGFVFSDDAPGVRLFGNLNNNKYQYNLAYFSRLDKDTNSGINTTFTDRHEDVYVANLFRQDALALGHQLQGVIIQRNDTAGNHGFHYDQNGFLVRPSSFGDERPKNIYSTYLGLNGDGHFGRINTTSSFYYVTGSESHNPIAERSVDINAGMAALELSYDVNWIRYRTSAFYASGDSDPFDNKAEGFDAINDSPNFAGGDLSYWQRQGIPLVGGGGVNLTNRLSLLPDLRAGKEEGQSNFVNPGLRLINVGVDFEVLPELKIITNASYLQFDEVAVLETIRHDGSISRDIGYDLSIGGLYRPFLSNNVQVRFGGAVLIPDDGVENLFGDEPLYDFFTNLILQY